MIAWSYNQDCLFFNPRLRSGPYRCYDKGAGRAGDRAGVVEGRAMQLFRDPFRLTRQDRIEDGEERWQTLGVVLGVAVQTGWLLHKLHSRNP